MVPARGSFQLYSEFPSGPDAVIRWAIAFKPPHTPFGLILAAFVAITIFVKFVTTERSVTTVATGKIVRIAILAVIPAIGIIAFVTPDSFVTFLTDDKLTIMAPDAIITKAIMNDLVAGMFTPAVIAAIE
jgi:hypothetical protein